MRGDPLWGDVVYGWPLKKKYCKKLNVCDPQLIFWRNNWRLHNWCSRKPWLFLQIGQFSHLGMQSLQTKWPLLHWCIGTDFIGFMQTGHSKRLLRYSSNSFDFEVAILLLKLRYSDKYLVQLIEQPILQIPNFNFPNLRCCKVFLSF